MPHILIPNPIWNDEITLPEAGVDRARGVTTGPTFNQPALPLKQLAENAQYLVNRLPLLGYVQVEVDTGSVGKDVDAEWWGTGGVATVADVSGDIRITFPTEFTAELEDAPYRPLVLVQATDVGSTPTGEPLFIAISGNAVDEVFLHPYKTAGQFRLLERVPTVIGTSWSARLLYPADSVFVAQKARIWALTQADTSESVSVQLKKGGSNIGSALSLTNADAAEAVKEISLATNFAAGDKLQADLTHTPGGGTDALADLSIEVLGQVFEEMPALSSYRIDVFVFGRKAPL